MYIPAHFAEHETTRIHALIEAHPLATWVVAGEGGLQANHVPFLLDRDRGTHGTLMAHVARANPVWRLLESGVPALVVFQGPQAYITPNWYPAKQQHGKVVPTWNYAAVHAHGVARAVDDPQWLRALLQRLTATHEATQPAPWRLEDAPADYTEQLLKAIVGIELPIDRLEGKWKVSQNRPAAERDGVVQGLRAQGDEGSQAMAALVQAALKP